MLRRAEGPPLVIGHRGAAAVAPENTLAALQAAVDAGAHLVEFDVGPDLRLAHSARDVPQEQVSLDTALDFLREHRLGVHLDVKLPGYESAVVDAIRRHGMEERGLVSTAFAVTSRRMSRLAPALPRAIGYPRDRYGISHLRWPQGPVAASDALLACGGARGARARCAGTRLDGERSGDGPPPGRRRCRRDRLGRSGNGAGYTARAVKRLLAAGLFVLGLAVSGVFSSSVIADIRTSTSSTTTVATTTAGTTTTPTTTAASPTTIPQGVRIAGVKVAGLTVAEAIQAVQEAFARPLPVVVDRSRLELDPHAFASAYVQTAVARARVAEPRTNVKLVVAVRGGPLRAWAAKVKKRFTRAAVDAKLTFAGGRPVVTKDRSGRALDGGRLTRRIAAALVANSRLPTRARTSVVKPLVTVDSFDAVIVINRSVNRLYLYRRANLRRTFAVATGQTIYPTPSGTFQIVVKWKNPWWYPPTQDSWAKGLKPVPPGPDNPLGTRWMGLSVSGVGIHGTDAPSSIGYSVSHGCIRMQVPDAEWLFDHVEIGTTVNIV